MWVAFAVQKLLTFFQQKNISILYIESTKTVNEMTLNELVKLMTIWTTGPWSYGQGYCLDTNLAQSMNLCYNISFILTKYNSYHSEYNNPED